MNSIGKQITDYIDNSAEAFGEYGNMDLESRLRMQFHNMTNMETAIVDEHLEDLAMLDEMLAEDRRRDMVKCHFCKADLHVDNNAMTRCMSGQEVASKGFGWISVIVEPFNEVPCCDVCFDKPETTYLMA